MTFSSVDWVGGMMGVGGGGAPLVVWGGKVRPCEGRHALALITAPLDEAEGGTGYNGLGSRFVLYRV
jgi:hypothetical protein